MTTPLNPAQTPNAQTTTSVAAVYSHPLEVNGVSITYRLNDGYIDATELCRAGGKLFKDWHRLQRSVDFLTELSIERRKLLSDLVILGNNAIHEHTWVDPQVATNIAQWLSPKISVKVSKWVYELITCGSVTLGHEKKINEIESMYKAQLLKSEQTIHQLQNSINNYDQVFFNREERKRFMNQVEVAKSINISNLDVHSTCYVRVLKETVVIDGVDYFIFKFGKSSSILSRLKQHEYEYKNSHLLQVFVVSNDKLVEAEFREYLRKNNLLVSMQLKPGGRKHCELFRTRPDLNINQVLARFQQICLERHPITVYEAKVAKLETKVKQLVGQLTACQNDKRTMVIDNEVLKTRVVELQSKLEKRKLKCTEYKERIDELVQKRTQYKERINELQSKYTLNDALIPQLKSEIESLTLALTIINNQLSSCSQSVQTPCDESCTEGEDKDESSTMQPATMKICVVCDTPCDQSDFPPWPNGNPCHRCSVCLSTEPVYELDESSPHRECYICGVRKNSVEFRDGMHTCKACYSDDSKNRARITGYDNYIKAYERKRMLKDTGKVRCTGCGEDKVQTTDFYSKGGGRYESQCKACANKRRSMVYNKVDTGVKGGRRGTSVMYKKDGLVSSTFTSLNKMSEAIGISRKTISDYMRSGEPYNGYTFIMIN